MNQVNLITETTGGYNVNGRRAWHVIDESQGEPANRGVPADELLSQPWVRELVERVNEAVDVPTALSAINDLLFRIATKAPLRPDTTFVGTVLSEGAQ